MGGGEWEEEGGGDLRGVELVGGCFPWCFFCGGLFPLLLGGGLLEGSGLLVGGGLRFVFVCGGLFLPVMTDPVPVPTSSGGGGKGGGRGGGAMGAGVLTLEEDVCLPLSSVGGTWVWVVVMAGGPPC